MDEAILGSATLIENAHPRIDMVVVTCRPHRAAACGMKHGVGGDGIRNVIRRVSRCAAEVQKKMKRRKRVVVVSWRGIGEK